MTNRMTRETTDRSRVRRARSRPKRRAAAASADAEPSASPKASARPRRALVREVAGATGAIDALSSRLGMVVLALGCGFAVGVVVSLLLRATTAVTDLVWKGAASLFPVPWFALLACTVGGLVIGLWTWWSAERVHSLEEVMGEFRRTGSFRTRGLLRPTVSFLLPLAFGGSVGFEAGLTGIITSACCWVRDRLKAAGLRVAVVADVTIAACVSAIFATPLAGIVCGVEGGHAEPDPGGSSASGFAPAPPFRIRAVANLWGYVRDLSVLRNASVPILSFQSEKDPVVPYRRGFPLRIRQAGRVYGTKAVFDAAQELGIPCEHVPCPEKAHRLHLDNDGVLTPRFTEIRDRMAAFFATALLSLSD